MNHKLRFACCYVLMLPFIIAYIKKINPIFEKTFFFQRTYVATIRSFSFKVPTRRGDFEILAYNLIHWLGGNLPWDQKLNDPMLVQKEKEQAMSDIPSFLKTAFGDTHPPGKIKFNIN